ncbi:glycoside hydrolase family 53 protein [Aulographum hederae CBS 113979]|uniref:Arabinogalactan endo-beta-1,4-galactanase n=1 Tax=Aulographum hederae CBS 113979 TaxID=1176131 RepID=A0A6G1GR08_9PEZI|nr:glycoside hydrolase family 53 protein [Aulographum hederae CBS 113979]
MRTPALQSVFLPLLLLTPPSLAALPYRGVDWSSTALEELTGKTTYQTPSGVAQPLEAILKSSGITTVRQRLWNNPTADAGAYNLTYNLALAARAKAAGLDVYVDFHYSDTWADPAHQTTPAAWARLGIDELADAVYRYTKESLDAFAEAGIAPTIVEIGNEIRQGMLWPLGRNNFNNFGNLARLLHSASAGVKDSAVVPTPKIMLHLDNAWDWATQKWWYDGLFAVGGFDQREDFDIIGLSHYPFYSPDATFVNLRSSLANLKRAYGKETMIVETDWPSSCPRPAHVFPSDVRSIPFSVEGQQTWVKQVAAACEDEGCTGLFYWEPAWIGNAGLGSSCEWNLMVEQSGKAMSSLDVFNEI